MASAVHERLSLSPAALVPRLHSAGQGTAASEVFTSRLLEDGSVYAPSAGGKGTHRATTGTGTTAAAVGGRYPAGLDAYAVGGDVSGAVGAARVGLQAFIASAIDEAVPLCR